MRGRTTPTTARRLLSAVALASAVTALAAPSLAQEPAGNQPGEVPQFAIQPSGPNGPGGRDYFVYDLAPGETFGDTVGISNLGDQPLTFAVYATDAYNTGDSAAFALLKEEEEPVDVGSWIQLAAGEYTVEPGMRADIPFAVTIPEDAEPGDHAGAIVAQPLLAGPSTPEDGTAFDVRLRIGARMYVRVDGPEHPSLRVDRLEVQQTQGIGPASADQKIEYVIRNDGNLRLQPTVGVRVEGPFGITLRTLPDRQLPELLPGGAVTVAETISGLPLALRLRTVVEATAQGAHTSAGASNWAVPWLLIGIVAVLAAARWWRRWRRSRRAKAALPPPPPRQRQPVSV